MDEHDSLAEQFEANRPHLRAVAYRMLGSLSEADDAVQESWLRLSRSGTSGIENLGGWLTTVVARVCLDMLRSRKSRHEESLDTQIADPIAGRESGTDPEQEALLADSVGLALLVVLETLAPAERLAFVLHDVFAVPFDEIAPMVGRSPTAARQLASRARRRVRSAAPAPDPDLRRQDRRHRRALGPCAPARPRPGRPRLARLRAEVRGAGAVAERQVRPARGPLSADAALDERHVVAHGAGEHERAVRRDPRAGQRRVGELRRELVDHARRRTEQEDLKAARLDRAPPAGDAEADRQVLGL